MKYIYTLIFSTFISLGLFSQTPASWTSADIYLGIKKLNVLGSVLYVAAHPDDENTRLIAYLEHRNYFLPEELMGESSFLQGHMILVFQKTLLKHF